MESPHQVVEKSIEVLERTRRSLSASGGSIDSKCQLLDKALVKQISLRQSELNQLPNAVPVIIRTSTPDPDVRCEDDSLGGSGPKKPWPSLPEDYLHPSRSFFESLNNTPQILPVLKSPRKPTPVIQKAPNVPWSPIAGGGEFSTDLDSVFDFGESEERRKMSIIDLLSKCQTAEKRFLRLIKRYDPSGYEVTLVYHKYSEWTKTLEDALENLIDAVDTLANNSSDLEQGVLEGWQSKVSSGESSLKELLNKIGRKISSMSTPAIQHPIGSTSHDNNVDHASRKAAVDAEVDLKIIREKAKTLSNEVKEVDDWTEAEDNIVEEYMGKIEGWKKTLEMLKDKTYSLEKNTNLHNLDNTSLEAAKGLMKTLESETLIVIEDIRTEDVTRCLYSLGNSKAAHVKLPSFSGAVEEDFSKFKSEVTKGFLANKVRRDDQPSKLRECLRGSAKKLIPTSMECINDCWSTLQAMYGDPSRVMKARKKKIKQMGKFPSDETSPTSNHLGSQIEWLLTIETTIKDIIELASEDEEMEREAYVMDTFSSISKLLPFSIQEKISRIKVKGRDKMAKIVDVLANLREDRQSMSKLCVEEDSGSLKSRERNNSHISGFLPRAAITYKQPQRDEECRICIVLNTEGDTDQIFEEHTHNVAIGCPRFAVMPVKEKLEYAKKAKLCIRCLDPKYIFKVGTPHRDCPAFNKKTHYSCQNKQCGKHYMLCDKHSQDNKAKIEYSKKFWEKKSKVFVHTALQFSIGKPVGKKKGKTNKSVAETAEPLRGIDATSSVNNVSSNLEAISLKKATEELKKIAKGAKVVEVPEGDPLFLFSMTKGKTRPINIFYDEGCSHCVFKQGVPGGELEARMTKKGPMKLGAVGASTVTVKDEWACLIDLVNGNKQVLQVPAVDTITADFPILKLCDAEKDLKGDKPNNKKLQKLKVPIQAGGSADILLGIKYKSLFPVHVHTLPCGLFIAELKIASDGGITGAIGGPHKSFSALSNQAGNTSLLIAHFVDGLKTFRSLGPPKLEAPILSLEDIELANKCYKAEFEEYVGVTVPEDIMKGQLILPEQADDLVDNRKVSSTDNTSQSSTYGYVNLSNLDHDNLLNDLKTVAKIQDCGISLDYRCPSCRSCSKCKNAPDTDRISLREEAECAAIRDSVKIDFEEKKITCTLPLRGREEDFLSNNRDIAVKVLDSQCKKVASDEGAKEAVIKSFYKLFDGGYAKRFDELTKEHQNLILSKPVQNYLPWRVVYKDSISTPVRTVMDASSKTPIVPDGKGGTRGGRCLNDLTVKGRIDTLDLMNMILRFVLGPVGYSGDLKQFYTSIGLEPSQWNLQRVLWKEGLDQDAIVEEIIITSLIFGVRAVSALSEHAVMLLAEHIKDKNLPLFDLLTLARFVDDIANSGENHEEIANIIKAADELFESGGLKVKAWTVSGSDPSNEVSKNGLSIDVAGMEWFPSLDTISVKIPALHFGRKSRGKIAVGTEIFDGSFADLETFVPIKLSRRQIVGKCWAVFDPLGKLTPETAKLKLMCREAINETVDWDDPVSPDTRSKFIQSAWRLHKLRGIKFSRAKIPKDAVSSKMYLMTGVDASDQMKIVGVWARFERKCGGFSSQLLIGRSLLSRIATIAQEELEAITIGSNLLWVCRKALSEWLEDYGLFGDSIIALCWIMSENKRLSIFHRNRVVQIRMHTDLDKLYHVRTAFNPADLGTRPSQVREDSVGPTSDWENGLEWMRTLSIDEAIRQDIIKPANALKISAKEEIDFDKGFVFERCPEILVKGHLALATSLTRKEKIAARGTFSKYLFSPMKYNFKKTVLITAIMFKHLKARVPHMSNILNCSNKFKVYTSSIVFDVNDIKNESLSEFFAHGSVYGTPVKMFNISDDDINQALNYWYKKATLECKQFNKPELLAKLSVEKDGILFSRSRILEGQRFVLTGGFESSSLGLEVGLNVNTPLIDRYSPIAYSIASFIHQQVANHAGIETCIRMSLSFCHIIQAPSLFREIADECVKCKMIRKKYLEAFMGPVSEHQLTICPPFYATYMDIDGPYTTYVPGFEKSTRNRQALNSKNWILSFACPVSKLINLQVIESKSAEGVCDGLTRLGCEHGFPKFLLLDQDSSFMKVVREADINLIDLSYQVFKEHGVRCEVSPVAGHNYTGLIEAKIFRVQQCLEKIGLKNQRIHSTGLQTFAKLVESHLNSLPMGFSYGKSSDNTPVLKIISPNMLKIGRLNARTLMGPVKFPAGPKGLMKNVDEIFTAFFRVWNISCVPKLIPQPKWFDSSKDLKPEDVVYFQKHEGDLSSDWTVGQVDTVTRSRDGVIRRAVIRYFNHSEDKARTTDRAVRSLVRLFNVEDSYFIDDMSKAEKLIKALEAEAKCKVDYDKEEKPKVAPITIIKSPDGGYKVKGNTNVCSGYGSFCDCCCEAHHKLNFHGVSGKRVDVYTFHTMENEYCIFDSSLIDNVFDYDLQYTNDRRRHKACGESQDRFFDTITALETDFALPCVDQI